MTNTAKTNLNADKSLKDFGNWISRLRQLLVEKEGFDNLREAERYGRDEYWHDYFTSGINPEDALIEDRNYW